MKLWLIPPLLFLSLPGPARAGEIYTSTKEYPFEYGPAPAEPDQGMDIIRGWLEGKPVPKLREITRPLRRALRRHLELDEQLSFKFAVLGAPRVRNGKTPYMYVWIEWAHESELPFDLDRRRYVTKAGVAKVALEGVGERELEIREWRWAERLEGEQLHELYPWDAAVLARKMSDFHKSRPRYRRDQPIQYRYRW